MATSTWVSHPPQEAKPGRFSPGAQNVHNFQMHRVYHSVESHFNVRHKGASCVLGNWRNSQSLSVTSPSRTIVHCPLLLARPHPTAYTYPPLLSPIDFQNQPLSYTCYCAPLIWRRWWYSVVLFCPFLVCCVQGLRTKHVLSQARVLDPPNHLGMRMCTTARLHEATLFSLSFSSTGLTFYPHMATALLSSLFI